MLACGSAPPETQLGNVDWRALCAPLTLRITGGVHRGRRIRSARVAGLRPTSDAVRAAIFSFLGRELIEGTRVLDLYAGTGALGIEALSRGAQWSDFVEGKAKLAQKIRENLQELSLDGQSRVYHARAERVARILPGAYDVVFLDPPYDMTDWESLMARLSEGELVKQQGMVVIEHRFATKLTEAYGRLFRIDSRRYGDTAVSYFRGRASSD